MVTLVSNNYEKPQHRCSFLTSHALVVLCIAGDPDARVRDIAKAVGLSERATQTILSDLVQEGYVRRARIGRRNRYSVRRIAMLNCHPLIRWASVGDLLEALSPIPAPRERSARLVN